MIGSGALTGAASTRTGLAYPARPGQRHHSRLAQRGRGLLQLPGAAHKRAHLQRQIPAALGDRAARRCAQNGRRELLYWGVLLGLAAGFVTDMVVTAGGA